MGIFTEGSTDVTFLSPVCQRLLSSISFQCKGEIDTELLPVDVTKMGLTFVQQVLEAAKNGLKEFNISILLVHTDADKAKSEDAYNNKIKEAQAALEELDDDIYCKNMVAIVPVYETEAWMLADKILFKKVIGTTLSDEELKINRNPETIARPKEIIEEAIRISRSKVTQRKRGAFTIDDLYQPLSQVEIEKLEKLESFRDFQSNLEHAFRKLNLLH